MDQLAGDDRIRATPGQTGAGTGLPGPQAGSAPGDVDAFVRAISEALIGFGMGMGGGLAANPSGGLPMLDTARRIDETRKEDEKRNKEMLQRRQEQRQQERS